MTLSNRKWSFRASRAISAVAELLVSVCAVPAEGGELKVTLKAVEICVC